MKTRKETNNINTKVCTKCKQEKPITSFQKNQCACKECKNKQNRNFYKNNSETKKISVIMYKSLLNTVREISSVLGISIASFIRQCIKEWIENHSEIVEIINKGE